MARGRWTFVLLASVLASVFAAPKRRSEQVDGLPGATDVFGVSADAPPPAAKRGVLSYAPPTRTTRTHGGGSYGRWCHRRKNRQPAPTEATSYAPPARTRHVPRPWKPSGIQYLWHGTTLANATNMIERGFGSDGGSEARPTVDGHGLTQADRIQLNTFGSGLYLTPDKDKAREYAFGDGSTKAPGVLLKFRVNLDKADFIAVLCPTSPFLKACGAQTPADCRWDHRFELIRDCADVVWYQPSCDPSRDVEVVIKNPTLVEAVDGVTFVSDNDAWTKRVVEKYGSDYVPFEQAEQAKCTAYESGKSSACSSSSSGGGAARGIGGAARATTKDGPHSQLTSVLNWLRSTPGTA